MDWIIILLVTIILYTSYELYCIAHDQTTLTITLRTLASKYPEIAFAFGFLMGHFFWQ
jgi:hypothetical protein